ncbi:DUF418 domain-containing protein [Pontibacillus yanchengensis]|uniref:DUF418 domain-containing protein n=1 Tax=Pontibacillus yanchengensis Y32 TaxID=1385514 RepID=A0A0A2TS70_9BACI|nr:DUF418 domain-containing protein [Pontibacillus yanchengensis]KGP72115.1 hypothetical protein N782_13850 [Pontibacillus yanchengensis Y32]
MNHAKPLEASRRLPWIDAARGLAILGIFMVNVPAFNAPYFMYGGEGEFWDSQLSHIVQAFIDIFFQASFYTLFSFLFGFGMYMMKERLLEKGFGNRYQLILARRLFVLIGFGLIHGLFIWHGDILFTYGMIGLLLFLFYAREAKTLVIWAFGLLTFYAISSIGLYYPVRDRLNIVDRQNIQQAQEAYGSGNWLEVFSQIQHDWLYSNGSVFQWIFLTLSLLPMFLLGMYFCKKRFLHETSEHKSTLQKWWAITLVLFIVFKIGPYLFGNPEWVQYSVQDSIGGSASAIFYITSVALMYQRGVGEKLFAPFTFVGRLSLTNYLLQSVICFFLFYSVGLGLYGSVPPIMSVAIVVGIYFLQVIASKLWLKSFRFGPFEWLWRTITYMKKQPLRRTPNIKEEVSNET